MDRNEVWKKHEADIAKAERVKDRASKKGFKDKVWKIAVVDFLKLQPLCHDCNKRGFVSVASKVLHKESPILDRVLFWDKNNWLSLCDSCHQRLSPDVPLVVLEPISSKSNLLLIED